MKESEDNTIPMIIAFCASGASSLIVMIMFCWLFRMHNKLEERVDDIESGRQLRVR